MTRPLFCRLFGHKLSTNQVWNDRRGQRDGAGVWFDLHVHCARPDCTANIQLGSFYVDESSMRNAIAQPRSAP